jgi:hypothetical protein
MTIGVIALLGLTYIVNKGKSKSSTDKIILASSGVMAGILPIAHPHSFIAVAVISATICFLNRQRFKMLSFFFVPATVISITLYLLFIKGGIQNNSFITFMPGWTAKSLIDFFVMWWRLWGLMIPTALLSFIFLFRKSNKQKFRFFYGFFVLFIIANLFLFQPTSWDNSKLFFWSYLGFSGLCAYLIVERSRRNISLKILMIFLFLFLTLTGALELIRVTRVDKHTFLSASRDDIELGEKIRQNTNPLDRFLTATTHNNLVMVWAARPILVGYTGWVRNFGFNYHKAEQDIFTMYKGGDESKKILNEYGVKYVFIGPTERNSFSANELYFKNNFPVAFSNKENIVFKIK